MLRISKYLSVLIAAFFKFLPAVIAGVAEDLAWFEVLTFASLGMMLAVSMILFAEKYYRIIMQKISLNPKRRRFSRFSRFAVKLHSKLGLWGIAILTPTVLSPILGTLLALSFKHPKLEIFFKMLTSALALGALEVLIIIFLKKQWGHFN